MRYPSDHKAEIAQRIVSIAALRFRAEGLAQVGIANLMADLGLTHGGFYAHFGSKEELVAAACGEALRQQNDRWRQLLAQAPAGEGLAAVTDAYLNIEHRDFPDSGCALAALAGELARQGAPVRGRIAGEVGQLTATLAQARAQDGKEGDALLDLALMVGCLALARLVNDADRSRQLLESARARLTDK
ncbi:TetR/AcrR family transcriptional regulator [Chromobacterium sp. IIBBL 290-4]|uniref:TetR/AcrR family transcriptional regulator n=1 Tax=Chromobacterium sp. IIBBL 290-4 TaxID=2953890 RepID=UPI0020B6EA31|nr:TetR/AcrR family transcriptional regulator [Chromobacterium sp. IIBBL 290-4]UTH76062.1 TetR/AcrR family transcriptional regulator [Chromobacterium sp. IIBBL 290-4]